MVRLKNKDENDEYWVPYLVMVPMSSIHDFSEMLRSVPSQSSDKSHFECKLLQMLTYEGEEYGIYRVAMHWTHKLFQKDNVKYYNLVYFTNHRLKLKNKIIDPTVGADLDWSLRNITSRMLVVKDKGVANSKFQTVYCAKEARGNDEPKPGWLMGKNGKFYPTEDAVLAAQTTVGGVVVYYNRNKMVEEKTTYTGLVVSPTNFNRLANVYARMTTLTAWPICSIELDVSRVEKKAER